MYHCHVHFYLTGRHRKLFDMIKEMSPLEHFTHEFSESEKPDAGLAFKADVILADLQGLDEREALRILLSGKKKETELILLADKNQILLLTDYLPELQDIWTQPMSEEEIRFRFLRWQQACKREKDSWQNSQFFETAINHIPNLIWYKGKNGIHYKVNDSFCKTVNKTKQQVEGSNHAYIWDVECEDPACIESDRQVMTEERTCISEETIQTGEGPRLLTTYKSPLYDLDGSVMGTVGVAIDITKERAYEQEIIQKNHTLETIFTTLDCGIMCHSIDGSRILSVNRAALKILGYSSQEELMSEGFQMIASSVMDEDKEKLRECITQLKKEGDCVSVEYRVQHKDGEILHVMGNVKLLKENGELFYQRFLLDCTAQKIKEKKRERQQEELVHALSIDYSFVCFYDLDTGNGKTLRADDTSQMLDVVFAEGLSYTESMERYITEFVYEEDREMLRQASSRENLYKELEENKLYHVNYRALINEEMKYFQMKVVCAGAWEEDHGIVLGFCSVDKEIRKEMEQKSQLEDALLQANRANKAKSIFLSNMSHDIRTPMNAIVGFTTLALNHIEHKDQVEEYLKKIMTSGNHLLNLINDVLDMSRIESGKMHLEEKPCSLSEIICGLRNIVQADVHAKQLELYIDTVNIRNEDIYCDQLRLNQVLLNLLSNSVKYTCAGGRIDMRVIEKTGAPRGFSDYEFHIKDTGIGMSEEFAARIFEPFEREKNTTLSGIQGTGLGMAITKNIVDMMNGSIGVKTKQGVGTEFCVSFRFRLNSDMNETQELSQEMHSGEQTAKEDWNHCEDKKESEENGSVNGALESDTGRILLAEDNELNQEIAQAILEDAGFEIEIAGNGQIAVDMLKQSEPGYYQLILMDVQMPVLDGYEATKKIRKLENQELSSIPILAMTANAFEEDRQEALRCGMNGHIAKPIDVEKLLEALEKILKI